MMPSAARLFELLLPSLCPACFEPLALDSVLHPHCWRQLHFVSRPYCDCCGMPLLAATENSLQCAACFENPPPWNKARSALIFKDVGRTLVLRFKYGDHIENASLFARWMMHAAYDILDAKPLIIPMPLHWRRLVSRRYNQAAELGRHLATMSNLPFCADMLKRRAATLRQSRLSLTERITNVSRAFVINKKHLHLLHEHPLLVVDDVLTSGATMRAACGVLRKAAPDATIFALTLAIVPHQ